MLSLLGSLLSKRKDARFLIFLCNIVRRKKIEDFQQGCGNFFFIKYALLNFIGDKIFAS